MILFLGEAYFAIIVFFFLNYLSGAVKFSLVKVSVPVGA